jgi:anti-sigma factor RsiW
MHNCKATRKRLIEEALDQTPSDQRGPLLAELERCPACRAEFASLRSVLRVADQAMESALPAESFWSGYHARLQQSLERDASLASRSRSETGALVLVRNLFTTSVRVPLPVAAILIVLFGLSIVFATHSRTQPIMEPLARTSSVVTRTVEVPVIQERTVTRVVYRNINRPTTRDLARLETTGRSAAKVTDRREETTESAPISLVGFKPTSDPKLTIIKGSYRDEK